MVDLCSDRLETLETEKASNKEEIGDILAEAKEVTKSNIKCEQLLIVVFLVMPGAVERGGLDPETVLGLH